MGTIETSFVGNIRLVMVEMDGLRGQVDTALRWRKRKKYERTERQRPFGDDWDAGTYDLRRIGDRNDGNEEGRYIGRKRVVVDRIPCDWTHMYHLPMVLGSITTTTISIQKGI